jgi:hypothetical protein
MAETNLTVKEIVRRFLVKEGFEGLFEDDGECACKLDDLMPCDGEYYIGSCEVGYIVPCEEGEEEYNFCVGREKPDANSKSKTDQADNG